jgi:chromate reductase
MPIYSVDKELATGIPELALAFAKKIDQSDLIVVSFAEHNGAYSTAFKNIFDWISRIPGRKAFGDKDMVLLATSTGARGGQGVLDIAKSRMPFSGGKVLASFSLPSFNENFKDGSIVNESLKQELQTIIARIA